MKKLLLLVAGLLMAGQALAFGVQESTIPFKTWENGKPNVMVLRTKSEACSTTFVLTTRGRFLWEAADKTPVEPLTTIGRDVLAKNGFDTDPNSTGFGRALSFSVLEVALGTAEQVRPLIPVSSSPADFQPEDLAAVPAGATKALLVMGKYSYAEAKRPRVLAVAFGDVSDDDLREIAFEEGVTRIFCWRK